ncbi:hypothetical protein N9L68_08795 [bacterium]|nr:hypothetical protein [bacterium]
MSTTPPPTQKATAVALAPELLSTSDAGSGDLKAPRDGIMDILSESQPDSPTLTLKGVNDVSSGSGGDDLMVASLTVMEVCPTSPANQQVNQRCLLLALFFLCAGAGHLSDASEEKGMDMQRVDYITDMYTHGMSKTTVANRLDNGISNNRYNHVPLAPPCDTYTPNQHPTPRHARYPEGLRYLTRPAQAKVKLANRVTQTTLKLMRLCCERNIPVGIGDPNINSFGQLEAYNNIAKRFNMIDVITD